MLVLSFLPFPPLLVFVFVGFSRTIFSNADCLLLHTQGALQLLGHFPCPSQYLQWVPQSEDVCDGGLPSHASDSWESTPAEVENRVSQLLCFASGRSPVGLHFLFVAVKTVQTQPVHNRGLRLPLSTAN